MIREFVVDRVLDRPHVTLIGVIEEAVAYQDADIVRGDPAIFRGLDEIVRVEPDQLAVYANDAVKLVLRVKILLVDRLLL